MRELKGYRRIGIAVVLALCAGGCLKRKERITVHPDGRVTMHLEYEADSLNELEIGDAMPSERAGWVVEHQVEVEDNGDETHTLIADREFPPGARLPQNFAAPEDPEMELYLQFPTTLTLERRPDGTYVHFRRVYPSRPWAQIEAMQQQIEESKKKELEEIENKKPEEMTHEDRVLLVKVAVYREFIKMSTFARWAWQDVAADSPQDIWLGVHSALERYAEETDVDRIARLIEAAGQEEDNAALEEEAQEFEAEAQNRMMASLSGRKGVPESRLGAFRKRYAWYKKQYEITEDLGDEAYELTVVMPGEIVASNAEKVEGNEAYWEIDGKLVRDRQVEVMVTSRVTD